MEKYKVLFRDCELVPIEEYEVNSESVIEAIEIAKERYFNDYKRNDYTWIESGKWSMRNGMIFEK